MSQRDWQCLGRELSALLSDSGCISLTTVMKRHTWFMLLS